MARQLLAELVEFLGKAQGKEVSLNYLRSELKIDPSSTSWNSIRTMMCRLADENIVKPTGRKDGTFKVITQVKPVEVFGEKRVRKPVFPLIFPRDFNTQEEMDFFKSITVREGDLITIGGIKSAGKTALCLNICAENIDKKPVLMGNEYTVSVEGEFEPAPRFLSRLDKMGEWYNWTDDKGMDKFMLLPVREDYAEHIVKDRINIVDWVNLDGDKNYDIGKVLDGMKANVGRGVLIVGLQKGEGAINPRGGQYVRDFSDLEILLDTFDASGDNILLTVKGAKEKTSPIVGKTYVYTLKAEGTQIHNFREVVKCGTCDGKKTRWVKGEGNVSCQDCMGIGWISK